MTMALAAAAIVTGSFLQRVSGMGVGLVVGPALGFLLGPQIGIYSTNVVTLFSALLLLIIRWNDIDWIRATWILVTGLPGALAGALLVKYMSTAWLEILVGGGILTAVMVTFLGKSAQSKDGPWRRAMTGIAGGALNATVGVAAAAMVLYARKAQWNHPSFGATLQPIFLGLGIYSVVSKSLFGAVEVGGQLPAWWYLFVAVAMVGIGATLGTFAARRISAHQAQKVSVFLAVAGSLVVLARGLITLAGTLPL